MKTATPEDIAFIEQHAVYFDQARLNFLHGLQPQTRNRFADIYRAYLDPGFILTEWCSQCVVDMMQRLDTSWQQNKPSEDSVVEPETHVFVFPDDLEDNTAPVNDPPPAKKRGRPKKQ